MRKNIILIGFMGCGKTTVGAVLAGQLGYGLCDTDSLIVEQEGKAIRDIFAEDGEERFRRLETNALKELEAGSEGLVISTGGGLPLFQWNGEILKRLGFVVFLKVKKETVLSRLQGDTARPLLEGGKKEDKVEELLAYRNPIYEYTAHMAVETDNRSPEEIGEEIIRNYKLMLGQGGQ